MVRAMLVALCMMSCTAMPSFAQSPALSGIVVDQTGLPLPGVGVRVHVGDVLVAEVITRADGTFDLPAGHSDAVVTASLDGFETVTVPLTQASRIVLPLARAVDTMTVVAPMFVQESPITPQLGARLMAETLARLPSARLKAKESLPLLPSVVRGNDGLLRVGGARPYETPLLIDGFNVTDPATGISSINLPFEAVRGVEVLRDPMTVSYGGLLGGLMQIASQSGGDQFKMGVQGFVPRPRFQSPGFGRLEGIFPRVFAEGSLGGRFRYLGTVEYDYERIPVPDVTDRSGRDAIEESATVFARADVQITTRHTLTAEVLVFPAATKFSGLSPRRDESATANNRATDQFAGVTDRLLLGARNVLTVRLGVLRHVTALVPNGTGAAHLSPSGWRGNWFAAIDRTAVRYSAAATVERTAVSAFGTHALSVGGSLAARRLTASVSESPIIVEDAGGRVVRSIDFSSGAAVGVHDTPVAAWIHDAWTAHPRLGIESGIRFDDNSAIARSAFSARGGMRFFLDGSGLTVLKAGFGRFIGMLPLAVEAFSGYPIRIDRFVDPTSGVTLGAIELRPAVGRLDLPRALASTVQIERQLTPGLDAQVGVTLRHSDRLATLEVPPAGGLMPVQSAAKARYRELQISLRRTWKNDQQLFVSYVRSAARGDLNDFAVFIQSMDVPIVRPGGMARTVADARHRWIAWSTFNLPRRIVVSPVLELRSGFPYSTFDQRYGYVGEPNGSQFPLFMAMDLVAYKTFTVRKRSADFGFQLFNATSHFNPRDVYPVTGAPRYRDFTNSVGPILRGFMLIKW